MALGHDSARITLDTYAHLIPGDEDRVRDAIDRLPLADSGRSDRPFIERSGSAHRDSC